MTAAYFRIVIHSRVGHIREAPRPPFLPAPVLLGLVVPATRHLPPALSRSAPAIQAVWLSALMPPHSLQLCFHSHRIFKIRRFHNKMGISKFSLKPVRKSGSSLQLALSVPPIRAVCFAGRPHALSVCRVPGAILGVGMKTSPCPPGASIWSGETHKGDLVRMAVMLSLEGKGC